MVIVKRLRTRYVKFSLRLCLHCLILYILAFDLRIINDFRLDKAR